MVNQSQMIFIFLLLVNVNLAEDHLSCDETHYIEDSGVSYRGCQNRDITGKRCVAWDKAAASMQRYGNYKHADLTDPKLPENVASGVGSHSYCRNPEGLRRSDIWCWNEDGDWKICDPMYSNIQAEFNPLGVDREERYLSLGARKESGKATEFPSSWREHFYFVPVIDESGSTTGAYHIYNKEDDTRNYLYLYKDQVQSIGEMNLKLYKTSNDEQLRRHRPMTEFYFEYSDDWFSRGRKGYLVYTKSVKAAERYYLTLSLERAYATIRQESNPLKDLTELNVLNLSTKPKYFSTNGNVNSNNKDCDAYWSKCDEDCTQKYIVNVKGAGAGVQCETEHNTQRSCMDGDCIQECKETYDANDRWKDYRGCQTKTESGKTCQKWTDQQTHRHELQYLTDSTLGNHNYCRNPSGEERKRIWCYTTDAGTEKEYCYPRTTTMYAQKNKNTFRYLKICTQKEGATIRPKDGGHCENITYEKSPTRNAWYLYTRSTTNNDYYYLTMKTGNDGETWVIKNVKPGRDGEFYFEEADPHGTPKSYGIYMLKNGKKQYISMNEDNSFISFASSVETWAEKIVVDFIPDGAIPDPIKAVPLPNTETYTTTECQDKDKDVAKMKITRKSFGDKFVVYQPKNIRSCAAIVRMIVEARTSLQAVYKLNSAGRDCDNMRINGSHSVRNLCCASCAALDEVLNNRKLPGGSRVFKIYQRSKGSPKCLPETVPDMQQAICWGYENCSQDIEWSACTSGVARPSFYRGTGDEIKYKLTNDFGTCELDWFVWYSCTGDDPVVDWVDWPEDRSMTREATLIYTKSYHLNKMHRNYLSAYGRRNLQTARITWAKYQKTKGDATDSDIDIDWEALWYMEDKPNASRGYIKGSLYARDPEMGNDYVMMIQHDDIARGQEHHAIKGWTEQRIEETIKLHIEPKGVKNGQTYYHIYTEGEETDTDLCADKKPCKYRSYLIAQDQNVKQYNEDYRVPLDELFLHYGKRSENSKKDELYDHEMLPSGSEDSTTSSEDEEDEDSKAQLVPSNAEWYFQDISQFTCQCVGVADSQGKYATCQPYLKKGYEVYACHVIPDVCDSDMETNEHNDYTLSTDPCKHMNVRTFYHEKMNYRVLFSNVLHMDKKTFIECRKICDQTDGCQGFNWRYWNLKHVDNNDRNCEIYLKHNAWDDQQMVPSEKGWNTYFKISTSKMSKESFVTTRMVDEDGFMTTSNVGMLQQYSSENQEWLYVAADPLTLTDLKLACKSLGYAKWSLTNSNVAGYVNKGLRSMYTNFGCQGPEVEEDLADCPNPKVENTPQAAAKITCTHTQNCDTQETRSNCNDIVDCKWIDSKGICAEHHREIPEKVAATCDPEDTVTNVHVILNIDSTKLSSGATTNPSLCLYTKGREMDDNACAEIKPVYADNKLGIGAYTKGSNWIQMSWWNGLHICDFIGKVKLKANHMDALIVKQAVVVVEGQDFSYVAVDPAMGQINKKLGITTTYNDIKFTNEYVWILSEDFGRQPDIDVDDDIDYVDQVWFAAQTSLESETESKQNPGFIMYAKVKFVDEQLYELTGGDQHRGSTSLWTVSNSEETNWSRCTISNINMMIIDHGNEHEGRDTWIFDKHMVIIKSKKGHHYVPSLDTSGDQKLEPNKNPSDNKSVPLKLKGSWFMKDGKKEYQSTMSNGYWKYLQRIDSNAPDFTYTASLSTETSTESEDTESDITTKEETSGVDIGVSLCLAWEIKKFGGLLKFETKICGSMDVSTENVAMREKEKFTGIAVNTGVETLRECEIVLSCTKATQMSLDDLDERDATSLACYAWQWMNFQYDEHTKEMKHLETCSFVVIDNFDNQPQCGESDCDDTTDCQKCLSGIQKESMCPIFIGVEYKGDESTILKHFKKKVVKSASQCQGECSKRIACKSWSFYKQKTADYENKDCILFNTMKPNKVNKAMVDSGVNCYTSTDVYKKEKEEVEVGKDCAAESKIKESKVWDEKYCENACKDLRDCRFYTYFGATKSCKLYNSCKPESRVWNEKALIHTFKKKTKYDSLGQGCCSERGEEIQNGGNGMTKEECEELCTERNDCVAFERKQIHADDGHGACKLLINKSTLTPTITVDQSNQCGDAMCYAKRPEEEPYCPLGYRQVGSKKSSNVILDVLSKSLAQTSKMEDCRKACENQNSCNAFTWNIQNPHQCTLGRNTVPEGNSGKTVAQRFCARLDVRDTGIFEVESENSNASKDNTSPCHIKRGSIVKGMTLKIIKDDIESSAKCGNKCAQEQECHAWGYTKSDGHCTLYKEIFQFQKYTASDAGYACFKIMPEAELAGEKVKDAGVEVSVSATGEQDFIEAAVGESSFHNNLEEISKVFAGQTEVETLTGEKLDLRNVIRKETEKRFDYGSKKQEEFELGKEQAVPKFADEMTSETPWVMYGAIFTVVASISFCMNRRTKDPESFSLLEEH